MNELVALRKMGPDADYGGRYKNISDFDPRYDGPFVSPWSKSAHNLDADVMVIGQDWSSSNVLGGPFDRVVAERGFDPKFPTNSNLQNLLEGQLSLGLGDVYATNLFVYIKIGAASKSIALRDMIRSARQFTIPMIDIIRPKIVVCLGSKTFNALLAADCQARKPWGPYLTALQNSSATSVDEICGVPVVGVSHTGSLGTANAKRTGGAGAQWQSVARLLHSLRSSSDRTVSSASN